MTPEREAEIRAFVARYDKWPKSKWANQDVMRDLLGEIDRLRSVNETGLEALEMALQQRNKYQEKFDELRIKLHNESAMRGVLVDRLKTYGSHKNPCEVINWMYDNSWPAGKPKPPCTCGYSKVCEE